MSEDQLSRVPSVGLPLPTVAGQPDCTWAQGAPSSAHQLTEPLDDYGWSASRPQIRCRRGGCQSGMDAPSVTSIAARAHVALCCHISICVDDLPQAARRRPGTRRTLGRFLDQLVVRVPAIIEDREQLLVRAFLRIQPGIHVFRLDIDDRPIMARSGNLRLRFIRDSRE